MGVQDLLVDDAKLASSPIKKKGKSTLRKAPQAPKRFKSSYILFFLDVQAKIKAEFDGKVSVTVISKKASELWKVLSAEDRQYWDDKAMKEKSRYMVEKATYTGAWQVPYKRAKKDPTAPKRNPSAFLLFAQGKRQELKNLNPSMKNTDISRILGQLWRDTPTEKKRHYVDREVKERKQYKSDIAEWRMQQATQLARKTCDTTSNPVSVVESEVGSGVQPVIWEDSLTARAYLHPYASHDPITSQGDYRATWPPSNMTLYGQYHQHPHMYPERPPQEQYTAAYRQNDNPSGSVHSPQKHCGYLSPQQHEHNSANGRYFNPISPSNNYRPSYVGSHAQQQQGEYENCFPLPNNNDHRLGHHSQSNIKQKRGMLHHRNPYQKQHQQHDLEQNSGQDMSGESRDNIKQMYAQDELKGDINLNHHIFYNQHQPPYKSTKEDDNLELYEHHHHHQPSQYLIDQNISHNMLSEKLDKDQQQDVVPEHDGRTVSPLNMYDDGDYEPVYVS